MFQTPSVVRTALENFYQDTAVIITQETEADKDTGIVTTKEVKTDPVPCRLSYSSFPATENDGVPKMEQTTKLFLSPDVAVTPGADIDVNHLGKTLWYKAASVPASYGSHQEVILTVREVY